jgi:hypothetical protein
LARVFQIQPEELEMQMRIDGAERGTFGEVWRAKYHDRDVAVKKLNVSLAVGGETKGGLGGKTAPALPSRPLFFKWMAR